jgi:phosphate transport system permease protein
MMIAFSALALALVVGAMVLILGDLTRRGWSHLTWEFLTQAPRDGMRAGGIFPALYGTVVLTLLMTVAVMPVGVVTAIYLHEYAPAGSWLASGVRVAVGNLAGVPSIVFGLFGLGFFVQFLGGGLDRAFGHTTPQWGQPGLIWAALTLAVLTLPTVIVTTEEALRAVPVEQRRASLALGATRSQTLWHIVLPQARTGILTGAILALARGASEVAPIMLTGVASFLPRLPLSLHSQFMHLGYHAYGLATQSPDLEATRPMLAATAVVLLLLTFSLNGLAVMWRARIQRL